MYRHFMIKNIQLSISIIRQRFVLRYLTETLISDASALDSGTYEFLVMSEYLASIFGVGLMAVFT